MSLFGFLAALFSIIFGALGQLFLKMGATRLTEAETGGGPLGILISAATTWQLGVGLMFYGTSALIWIYVLSMVNLSVAYPMVGLSFVIVVMLGVFVLGERVSVLQVTGCVLILTGIAFVTRG